MYAQKIYYAKLKVNKKKNISQEVLPLMSNHLSMLSISDQTKKVPTTLCPLGLWAFVCNIHTEAPMHNILYILDIICLTLNETTIHTEYIHSRYQQVGVQLSLNKYSAHSRIA